MWCLGFRALGLSLWKKKMEATILGLGFRIVPKIRVPFWYP